MVMVVMTAQSDRVNVQHTCVSELVHVHRERVCVRERERESEGGRERERDAHMTWHLRNMMGWHSLHDTRRGLVVPILHLARVNDVPARGDMHA